MSDMKGVGASGHGGSDAVYTIPDDEVATGSTLGGPKICAVIKATGAIEKVFNIDAGEDLFGTLVLHHWDERTGASLRPLHPGTFTLHPEHQERRFVLANDVAVHEDIFVLNGHVQDDGSVDPPAVYYTVALRNDASIKARIATYAFCQLRGGTPRDVVATF